MLNTTSTAAFLAEVKSENPEQSYKGIQMEDWVEKKST